MIYKKNSFSLALKLALKGAHLYKPIDQPRAVWALLLIGLLRMVPVTMVQT